MRYQSGVNGRKESDVRQEKSFNVIRLRVWWDQAPAVSPLMR